MYRSSIFIFFIVLLIQALQAKEFYVDPHKGNDKNPGNSEKPFATLAQAKHAVRAWNAVNGNESITIWLLSGEYRLRETLVFTPNDGAKPGQTIRYAALPGHSPIISSDVVLDKWEPVREELPGLPKNAAGKIWKMKVPDDVRDFHVAFNENGTLSRAQTGPIAHRLDYVTWVGPDSLHTQLPVSHADLNLFEDFENAEVLVVPAAPWTINRLTIRDVDEDKGLIHFNERSTYALASPRFFHSKEAIWIENTFAGLNQPGRWKFDKKSGYLYYWPAEGGTRPPENLAIPTLTEFIRIEGVEGATEADDIPVMGLQFSGLTFQHGNRYSMSGQTGLGLQHDWELFDSPTAMVRLRGARHCVIESCTFQNSGGTAIRLDLHAQHNRVVNNTFRDIGGSAVLLAGYGPGAKDVNKHNIISNNHIQQIGTIWWHSIAIWAWQSGDNLIANNTIRDIPYTAIAVTGRIQWDPSGRGESARTISWNEVAGVVGSDRWEIREPYLHGRRNRIIDNDISDVVKVMNDGNAIYISGAGRDNYIARNYIHTTLSELAGEAIRCDDDQHETLIENNLIYRFGTHGIGLCSKGRNHFLNNIVALPPNRVNRGMLSLEPTRPGICAGSIIAYNIFFAQSDDQPIVFMDGMKSEIEGVESFNNIYYNSANPLVGKRYIEWAQGRGKERNSIWIDPEFENIETADFRLKDSSPAHHIGFNPFTLNAGIK